MLEAILIAIAGAVAVAILGFATHRLRGFADQVRVRRWLVANTKDGPGESHVAVSVISSGIRLPEDRVLRACIASKHVLRSQHDRTLWSVWRSEPQSIYEKRGLRTI